MKTLAHILSYLFHPILMVSYGLVLLYLINPYLFSISDSRAITILFIYVFLLSVFFPVLSIGLLKSLGFVSSLHMRERTDRVGPLIATAVFYLWLFINIFNNPGIPRAFSIFVLGTCIAILIAFFINNFTKISLHAIGVGGALTGAILIKSAYSYDSFGVSLGFLGNFEISTNLFLMVIILLCGAVATSRLILGAHQPKDIYGGLLVGAFSQLLAIVFLFE